MQIDVTRRVNREEKEEICIKILLVLFTSDSRLDPAIDESFFI